MQTNCESVLNFKIFSTIKLWLLNFFIKFYIEQLLIFYAFWYSNCTYSVACEQVMNGMGCSLIQWEYEGFPKIIPERGSGQRVDFVRT